MARRFTLQERRSIAFGKVLKLRDSCNDRWQRRSAPSNICLMLRSRWVPGARRTSPPPVGVAFSHAKAARLRSGTFLAPRDWRRAKREITSRHRGTSSIIAGCWSCCIGLWRELGATRLRGNSQETIRGFERSAAARCVFHGRGFGFGHLRRGNAIGHLTDRQMTLMQSYWSKPDVHRPFGILAELCQYTAAQRLRGAD
jgi:hypothetical protein